jgi:Fe-S oxidoreductase
LFEIHLPRRRGDRGLAIYFADTWTNHYWPSVGVAAVRLLEAAGYEVVSPRLECCGRPAISKGLLDQAARLARKNIEALEPFVRRGAWIVGSEPSCILTMLDEYPHFVRTPAARELALRVRSVDSLLAEDPDAIVFAADARPAPVLLHGHCHQKALVGTADTLKLLNATPGIGASEINSGCCGMAGSFGHEAAHYEVARAIGEQRLFPAVRGREESEIAVCGFSCREQIAHHTGIKPRHVLEVVAERLPEAT